MVSVELIWEWTDTYSLPLHIILLITRMNPWWHAEANILVVLYMLRAFFSCSEALAFQHSVQGVSLLTLSVASPTSANMTHNDLVITGQIWPTRTPRTHRIDN